MTAEEMFAEVQAKFKQGLDEAKTARGAAEKAQKEYEDAKKSMDERVKEWEEKLKAMPEMDAEDLANWKKSHEEVKEFLAKEGRRGGAANVVKTFGALIFDLVGESKANLELLEARKISEFVSTFDRKAVTDMTLATNLTGNGVFTYRPGIVERPFWPVHLRDLVAVTPSATDSYHFYRHTQSEGTIAFQGGETNVKAKIDEDYTEVTVNLDYLAGYLNISRKMLRNLPALQSQLSRWLPERYYQREDVLGYAALAGTAGLTPAVTTGANDIDNLLLTIGALEDLGHTVTSIAVRPSMWARLLTNASTDGIYSMPGSVVVTAQGGLQFVGIPIVKAIWVPANTAVVGDWRKFEIIQSEALSLRVSEHNENNFIKNMLTFLIEASVGFAVLDPSAFSILTFGT